MKRITLIIFIVTSLVLFSGCGSDGIEIDTGEGKLVISADQKEIKIVSDDNKSTTVISDSESAKVPEEYPEDILPVYDGVLSTTSVNEMDGRTYVNLYIESKDSMEEVTQFFDDLLNGENEYNKTIVNGEYASLYAEIENKSITIQIMKDDEDNIVKIIQTISFEKE